MSQRVIIAFITFVALIGTSAHAAPEAWVQTAKFTASDQAAQQRLGSSVAVSADGNTIALGAPGTASQGNGAVYVYTRQAGSAWSSRVEAARLTASDGAAGDQLGAAIAISADGSVIVVGSPNHLVGSTVGAAYVFVRNGATWSNTTEAARLSAASANGDSFRGLGASVAISRDGKRVIVGAPNSTLAGPLPLNDAGAALMFSRPLAGWATSATPTSRLTPPASLANDLFGAAVATNDDGTTIVVGASGRTADNANAYRGVGYVFDASGNVTSVLASSATLRASNTTDSDDLGASAAMDASGDTILLGAPGSGINPGTLGDPTTTGAAFVFTRPTSGWSGVLFSAARLVASDGVADDYFGTSASLSADGRIAAFGTPGYDDAIAVPDDGAGQVFFRQGNTWSNATEDFTVPAQNLVGGEAAGKGIGLSAGAEVLVLGAPLENFGPNPNVNPNPKSAGAGYALQLGAEVVGPTQLTIYINAPLSASYTVRGIPTPTLPAFAGSLPAGVTFNAITSVLSGTPTQGGDFTYTLSTSNFIGYPYSAQLVTTMKVINEVAILGAAPPVGVVSRAYTHTFMSNVANPTWGLTSGALPNGITFNNGSFSGAPTASGAFTFTIKAQSGPLNSTRTASILVYDVLTITTPSLAAGYVGVSFLAPLVTNIAGPAAWSVASGALPPGLGLNPTTGEISGLPAQAGDYAFIVSTALASQTATRAYALHINPALVIDDVALPTIIIGSPLLASLTTNVGGVTKWSIASGALPAGVSLNATSGVLSGVPLQGGDYAFVVRAIRGPQTALHAFTLRVESRRTFMPIVQR